MSPSIKPVYASPQGRPKKSQGFNLRHVASNKTVQAVAAVGIAAAAIGVAVATRKPKVGQKIMKAAFSYGDYKPISVIQKLRYPGNSLNLVSDIKEYIGNSIKGRCYRSYRALDYNAFLQKLKNFVTHKNKGYSLSEVVLEGHGGSKLSKNKIVQHLFFGKRGKEEGFSAGYVVKDLVNNGILKSGGRLILTGCEIAKENISALSWAAYKNGVVITASNKVNYVGKSLRGDIFEFFPDKSMIVTRTNGFFFKTKEIYKTFGDYTNRMR